MFLFIILIAFAVVMLAMGLSAFEVAIACGMILAFTYLLPSVERWVELRTGHTTAAPSETYKAVSLLVALLIGTPPIFLLPGAHVLVIVAFWMLGMLIGGLVAQAYFGKHTTY